MKFKETLLGALLLSGCLSTVAEADILIPGGGTGAGSGTVTAVGSGTGLTGGPITTTGTLSVAPSTANTLAGYDNSGVFSDVTIGTNLTLSGGTLSASGGSGSVTSVATGTGLTGGPITTTGTLSLATNTDNTLAGYNNSGVFSDVAIGTGLALSGGTLSATTAGTVSSITAGTGLAGGTITTTGTISIPTSGVSAASYTNSNITVNAEGIITAASSPGGVINPNTPQSISSNTTLTAGSASVVDINSASNTVTIILPGHAAAAGQIFIFDVTVGGHSVTITPASGDTIGTVSSMTITGFAAGGNISVLDDGTTDWKVIGCSLSQTGTLTGTANQVGVTTFDSLPALQPMGYSAWGGNGKDASITKGAVTESTVLNIDALAFTQTASTTWQPVSGTVLNTANSSNATFSGTTTVQAGYAGGTASFNSNTSVEGRGDGGGQAATALLAGGGTGNGGTNGGIGGQGSGANIAAGPLAFARRAGSGGASGSSTSATTVTDGGGAGGGLFTVCATGNISIGASGTINCNGTVGQTPTASVAGGGSGGSGGTLYLAAYGTIVNSGTLSAVGGAGGNSGTVGYGGNGGGGGWIVAHTGGTLTIGTTAITGGGAGTGGTANGNAGSSGVVLSIADQPSQPIMGWNLDHLHELAAISKDMGNYRIVKGASNVTWMAARVAKDGPEFRALCRALHDSDLETTDNEFALKVMQLQDGERTCDLESEVRNAT